MTLLHRFRKLVFIQVMMGILAFTIATGSPALLVVAGMMAAMAWYIVEGPRGRPFPQWLIMPGALCSFGWLMMDLFWDRGDVVMAMGRFTVCLQVVMLFGQKRNREYGLILVLGLMQMVAASVLTNSMMYGLLLIAYCFCALLTVLMFHLKATSDSIVDANRGAAPSWVRMPELRLIHGQGDRGHFRGIALMIGLICGIVGAIVFVTTPRHDVDLLRDSLASMRFSKRVGFSPTVSLTGAPFGGGTGEIVMYMTVRENGEPIDGEHKSWLVRGAALDQYDFRTKEWSRRNTVAEDYDLNIEVPEIGLTLSEMRFNEPYWDVEFSQRMSGSNILFSINPISSFHSDSLEKIQFNVIDQMLQTTKRLSGVVRYRQRIAQNPRPHFYDRYIERLQYHSHLLTEDKKTGTTRVRDAGVDASGPGQYARQWHDRAKKQQIKKYANDVLRGAGMKINTSIEPGDDYKMASILAEHLRTTFKYELTNDHFKLGYDPIYEFLSDTKRGHCEMFAASLAALARCVGMPARVISGFRASEFNRVGSYYTIRQDDAHAWTEIYCGRLGWVTFDATPAADVELEHAVTRTWMTPFNEIYEYIELAWTSGIVNYNRARRQEIMVGVEATVKTMLEDDTNIIGAAKDVIDEMIQAVLVFKQEWAFNWPAYALLAVTIACVLILLVNLLVMLLSRMGLPNVFKWFRSRRDRRMPTGKHVRFYANMLELLRKHGHTRPDWQSPYKFASDLRRLDAKRFDTVVPLTEMFYEIRYGHREPDTQRRSKINELLKSLRRTLKGT